MNKKFKPGWNELYKKGFRARYPNEDVIRFIEKNFPEKENKKNIKILDFGFGTGRHIIYLAKEGFDVYGVEIAESGIELTKKWLEQEELKATLKQIDNFKLPFPDEYFDAVIDCAAIQHNRITEIEETISEMHRVLKKNGKVFSFCKAARDSLYGLGNRIEKYTFYYDNGTDTYTLIHFFITTKLRSLWSKFKNVEIEYTERTINNMTEKVAHFIISITK